MRKNEGRCEFLKGSTNYRELLVVAVVVVVAPAVAHKIRMNGTYTISPDDVVKCFIRKLTSSTFSLVGSARVDAHSVKEVRCPLGPFPSRESCQGARDEV